MKTLCRKFCKKELGKVEALFNGVGGKLSEEGVEVEEDREEEVEEG